MSDSAALSPNHLRQVSDAMHVRLFQVDALRIEAGHWNAQEVRSPFWRFYRNEDAGAYVVLHGQGGRRYPFAPGRVYFVPAGVRFSCGNEAPFRHFYVHFDVVGLPSLTMRALFDGPVALPPDTAFESSVADFAQEAAMSRPLGLGQQCRAKALVYEGFARHLEALPVVERVAGLQRAEALEPVAPAVRHIEERLAERITVAELAARCCLSEDHFARKFKECVGSTPLSYITERRVTLAAQRLVFTEDSLDSIAAACGFGTREYLTRVFTRATNLPPAAYRKAGRR